MVKGCKEGFAPVRVTQWPPPGTPLWRNTTTDVTITATDASNRRLECVWKVSVAPLVELGEISMALPSARNGTYTKTGQFLLSYWHRASLNGIVLKMKGQLQGKLSGRGSSIGGRLRRGSNKLSGRLTFNQTRTKGGISVNKVPIEFSSFNVSDVRVEVRVRRTMRRNNVTYKVLGQVRNSLF
jgi:hypothetical protein